VNINFLGGCRKCLCRLPGLSDRLATNSTPTGQQQGKPTGKTGKNVRKLANLGSPGKEPLKWRT